MKTMILALCVFAATLCNTTAQNLVHPGGMHSQQDLNFVKAKLQTSQQPWQTAWTQFLTTDAANYQGINPEPFASLQYQHHAYEDVICGSYNNPNIGCNDMVYDGMAAYSLALRFYMTDDVQYATKAINIINAWSVLYKTNQDSNSRLVVSWAAPWYVNAAEILRYTSNSGWTSADTNTFNTMLNRFKNYIFWEGRPSNNWMMSSVEARIAIAVFQDDITAYNEAVGKWKDRVKTYIYQSTDGVTPIPPAGETVAWTENIWHDRDNRTGTIYVDGLCMETCRDISHTKLGFFSLMNAAEMVWTQGEDLFQLEKDRIADFLELHSNWMMGGTVPNNICDGYLDLVSQDGFEVAYSQLHDRLNVNLPNTLQMLNNNRPSNAGRWVKKWETLMYADRSFGMPCVAGAPNGFANAVNENSVVSITNAVDIAYGADCNYTYLYEQETDTPCNNATFGDPIPGVVKKCYTRAVVYPHVQTATAEQDPNVASHLFDNDVSGTSRWSAEGFPQSVVIDHGTPTQFSGVEVWTFDNRAYQYTIALSNMPDSGFVTVIDRSGNTATTQPVIDNFTETSARYVKLTVTGADNYTGNWVSINELKMQENSLSVEDYTIIKKDLKVYPNPSETGVFILSEHRSWTIYSVLGSRISSGEGTRIDLSDYESGMYFLKTKNETKLIVSKL